MRSFVLVPGLGLSGASWGPTLGVLGAGAEVVTVPGFGERAPRRTALDPAAQACRVLESADLAGRVVLGHSASCQIVAEAAARARRPPAALVLVGPTTDPSGRSWPRLAERWLRTAAHEWPAQAPLLARDYLRTGLGGMARAMDAARRHRIEPALAATPCPVLVVRGRHDRIAPAGWAEHLARTAPRGRAFTLPEGGHMVPLTHPQLVAPILRGLG
ncbi:alpha/beta fold hydrolase [Pseudonocardia lutea]|jgi:pimeloyl-ACP methyl ester carboxylesterase|uniref:Alpha/beta fold hydrolase n=1 Tax=Pseudonocardia lutea TaxID=2172015 RepID=A0ABW1I9J3_9PSEU